MSFLGIRLGGRRGVKAGDRLPQGTGQFQGSVPGQTLTRAPLSAIGQRTAPGGSLPTMPSPGMWAGNDMTSMMPTLPSIGARASSQGSLFGDESPAKKQGPVGATLGWFGRHPQVLTDTAATIANYIGAKQEGNAADRGLDLQEERMAQDEAERKRDEEARKRQEELEKMQMFTNMMVGMRPRF